MKKMSRYVLFLCVVISAGIAQASSGFDDGEGPDVGTPEWHRCQARGGCNYH